MIGWACGKARQHIMVGAHGRAKLPPQSGSKRERKREALGFYYFFRGTPPMT
jgi:hypothetical protein